MMYSFVSVFHATFQIASVSRSVGHVAAIGRLSQDPGRDEHVYQGVTHEWVEPPEALHLSLTQTETRHLPVFRLNQFKPAAHARLIRHHLGFSSSSRAVSQVLRECVAERRSPQASTVPERFDGKMAMCAGMLRSRNPKNCVIFPKDRGKISVAR
jgi:hypothetical protein